MTGNAGVIENAIVSFSFSDHSPANQRFARVFSLARARQVSLIRTRRRLIARPPYKLPVLSLIAPIAYGPIKPPRLAMQVITAMGQVL